MSGDERQPIVGPSAPCLSLALALIAGIWLGERQPISLSLIVFCAPLVPLVFIYYRYRKMGWLIALCVVAAVGALLIHARLNTSVPAHHIAWFSDGERVVLTGIVDEPPVRRQEDSVIIIRSESVGEGSHAVAVTGRVRITVKDPAVSWRYGDRLRLKVKLNHPRNFGNPGAFDYVGYLNRKGIRVAGYLRNVDGVHVVAANRANPVFGWFDRRRLELEKFLDAHTEPPGRGLLKALLIGERAEVTGEMRDAFVSAGAVHVMAISGLHLGIIVTLVFFAAQWALRRSESILLRWNVKKVAALVTMVPLMGYIMITGCPISTIFT